ncbi:unnamed protein product [Boreogadus saida]
MASQSVPMVTNSGGMGAGDDEVFMEQEGEGLCCVVVQPVLWSSLCCVVVLTAVCPPSLQGSSESHPDPEASGQQSEDAALPSTSQDPDSSSAPRRPLVGHAQSSSLASRGPAFRGRGDGRTTLIRRDLLVSGASRPRLVSGASRPRLTPGASRPRLTPGASRPRLTPGASRPPGVWGL